MTIEELTLIRIEYNSINGFIFLILNVEVDNLESSLFGIHLSRDFLYVELLFKTIKIFSKAD